MEDKKRNGSGQLHKMPSKPELAEKEEATQKDVSRVFGEVFARVIPPEYILVSASGIFFTDRISPILGVCHHFSCVCVASH